MMHKLYKATTRYRGVFINEYGATFKHSTRFVNIGDVFTIIDENYDYYGMVALVALSDSYKYVLTEEFLNDPNFFLPLTDIDQE
jgi:hypothetical protein